MTFSDITPKHFPIVDDNNNSFKYAILKSICFIFGSVFLSSKIIQFKRNNEKNLKKLIMKSEEVLGNEKNDKYIKIWYCIINSFFLSFFLFIIF